MLRGVVSLLLAIFNIIFGTLLLLLAPGVLVAKSTRPAAI